MTFEQQAAAALRIAREQRRPIAPFANIGPGNPLDTAYRVQQINVTHQLAHGARIVGRKIGLTSHAVQVQLGVQQPDYGVLFDHMMIHPGVAVPMDRLVQPKIEAEIAFVLKSDLLQAELSLQQIAAAVDHVVAAAEIVDSAIEGWRISLFDTIADNASCGMFALSTTPVPLSRLDLRLCGMVLTRNGVEVSFGAGAACLGSPLNAVRWLAQTCAARDAPLRAGEIVLSGALGPMVAVSAGDRYRIEIAGLGGVDVNFSDAGSGQ